MISLGSNIQPAVFLPRAVQEIGKRFPVTGVSRVYLAEPVGAPDAPTFLNAAVAFRTDLAPLSLKFDYLRPIETLLGRVRGSDLNAPRTIDLDIALMGDLVIHAPSDGIEIPDPDILTCAHVALPLADLARDITHPVSGETLGAIAARFADRTGVRVYHELALSRS
jgi:2-amino-4-hydroxy-6-hydroxymethyldihydropteridine diphosphokinase